VKDALAQSAIPAVGNRVKQRIEALGAALVSVEPTGAVSLLSNPRWIEPVLMRLPAWPAAVRGKLEALAQPQGSAVEIWPGLWLTMLPGQRKRRLDNAHPCGFPAALFLSAAFLQSEEFQLACSVEKLDADAVRAQAQNWVLAGAAEVQRLSAMFVWMQQDCVEADRRVGELHTLSQQLGESYEELSLLYKLSNSMTLDRPPAHFLTESCLELQQVLGLKWMALQLVENEPTLNELAGQVFLAGNLPGDTHLLKRIGAILMQRQTPGQPPLVVDDTQTLHIPYLPRLAGQLIVVALVREDKQLGILFGGDKIEGGHISSVDSKLCNSLAASLSMFLENLMLFEDMSAMFLGTLHALTASIDAKDRYTHGHSERVAMLARQLGTVAGLDAHDIDRVYLSGLVHDIGKIGVPEAVLCKPGKLTEQEYTIIRTHPEIGAGILQDIRPMQDLVPGVFYHHERWDGLGYPHGLQGENIPLYGRIICIADSFDAMISTRTYRQALSLERVLGEIKRCAGKQFDPHLVDLFLQLDFQPFVAMVQQQNVNLPLPQPPVDPPPPAAPASDTESQA